MCILEPEADHNLEYNSCNHDSYNFLHHPEVTPS